MRCVAPLLFLCLFLGACVRPVEVEPEVAWPVSVRPGVFFTYYGAKGAQHSEVAAHTNLLWESQFDGFPAAMERIADSRLPYILDVSPQLYTDEYRHKVREDAALRLRGIFSQLEARGLLPYLVGVYPIDEPDVTVVDEDEVRKGNALLRSVMNEYPALKSAVLVVIYANTGRFSAIDSYDWVGFDDYDRKSWVLGEPYAAMLERLRGDQRTLVVPGGAFGQQPQPFLEFANAHREVAAMVTFVWFDNWDVWDQPGRVGKPGVRSNGMAPAYERAGRLVTGK